MVLPRGAPVEVLPRGAQVNLVQTGREWVRWIALDVSYPEPQLKGYIECQDRRRRRQLGATGLRLV